MLLYGRLSVIRCLIHLTHLLYSLLICLPARFFIKYKKNPPNGVPFCPIIRSQTTIMLMRWCRHCVKKCYEFKRRWVTSEARSPTTNSDYTRCVCLSVADGCCWFVIREQYCWLAGGWCWFSMREQYCWLVGWQAIYMSNLKLPTPDVCFSIHGYATNLLMCLGSGVGLDLI